MTRPDTPSHQEHLNAVLEPIAPGSRYDFVEIESIPIAIELPWARVSRFIKSAIHALGACVKSQWKIAIALLVFVVIAEFSLRTMMPGLMGRIYTPTQTAGHPIAMNAQGFRGDQVNIPKPIGTTRILALGDSVTFGTGIDVHDAWPARLQKILSTDQHPVQVINTGLPALDLGQINLELTTRWREFEPDQIVLVVSGNMVSFAYARRDRQTIKPPKHAERAQTPDEPSLTIKERAKEMYASLALPGSLTIAMEHLKFGFGLESHAINPEFPVGVMLAHGYRQTDLDEQVAQDAWSIFEAQLEVLNKTAISMNVSMIVVYSSPRFATSDERSDNLKWVNKDRLTIDPSQRLQEMCNELDIEYIDPTLALREAPKPVYSISDYTHFEPSGHHAIAELIANSIKNAATTSP